MRWRRGDRSDMGPRNLVLEHEKKIHGLEPGEPTTSLEAWEEHLLGLSRKLAGTRPANRRLSVMLEDGRVLYGECLRPCRLYVLDGEGKKRAITLTNVLGQQGRDVTLLMARIAEIAVEESDDADPPPQSAI